MFSLSRVVSCAAYRQGIRWMGGGGGVVSRSRRVIIIPLCLSLYFNLVQVTTTEASVSVRGSRESGLFLVGSAGLFRLSSEESSADCSRSSSCEDGGSMSGSTESDLFHVDFEVFGEVQGVFFRKYTQKEGTKLGLRGFCRNTRAGTVTGSLEGARQPIDQMKHWLQHTGSPMSRISNAAFKNEKRIDAFTLPPSFDIARTV